MYTIYKLYRLYVYEFMIYISTCYIRVYRLCVYNQPSRDYNNNMKLFQSIMEKSPE